MTNVKPSAVNPKARHRLDPARIIETAENLSREIGDRLPGSSLAGLAVELIHIAQAADERAKETQKPIYSIRAASVLAVGVTVILLWVVGTHIHAQWEFGTITEVFEAADAGFNLLAILAGALWFFVSLEARLKRKMVLGSMEELREFIHVIDVTQLYYTPELYRSDDETSPSLGSLKLDYTYFLFCNRMLAVISNLAPLYTRGVTGDSILRAVTDIEMLANAISVKLQSKSDSIRGQ